MGEQNHIWARHGEFRHESRRQQWGTEVLEVFMDACRVEKKSLPVSTGDRTWQILVTQKPCCQSRRKQAIRGGRCSDVPRPADLPNRLPQYRGIPSLLRRERHCNRLVSIPHRAQSLTTLCRRVRYSRSSLGQVGKRLGVRARVVAGPDVT